ncbi:adenylyltransferase and sulfurtransferase MOCS3-like [Physella acuta]|uniref:adenylyltransferase and sulfurtransferase MOCS3-like n=1 Tax=Physella acuta TaxID=109671 RepID=UPI0027DDD5CA|nr:adenylyltransferase and sulfurtransferase MOCS3-like [Physella acuta]
MSSELTLENLKLELQKKEEEINRLKKLISNDISEKKLTSVTEPGEPFGCEENISKLSKEDVARYSRQLILPELGVKGQLKLRNSSALIVGAGGLGCPAAVYLAAAGIGRLGVVDYDEVDLSNLHRQILHTTHRIGLSKSLSVSQACHSINPNVEYIPYQLQLDSSNALEIIKRYDVVLDATDNVATRYLLNDACVLAGKPLISGSALRFEGQLTVYNHEGGPCYRCLFPQPPPPETVTNCSEGGVIGVVPGIIGSIQALEAIKILSGIGTSFKQRLLLFDALDGTFRSVKLRPRSKDCSVCGDNPTIHQLIDYEQFCGAKASDKDHELHVLDDSLRISAKEYSAMLEKSVPHLLLDVRPSVELDICQLPHPAINIPFTNLMKNIPEAVEQIEKEFERLVPEHLPNTHLNPTNTQPHIVCVCRRGNDSQLAVESLKSVLAEKSVTVVDIRGGLHSWGRHVDTDFPIY